jgi:hypothetical protein
MRQLPGASAARTYDAMIAAIAISNDLPVRFIVGFG